MDLLIEFLLKLVLPFMIGFFGMAAVDCIKERRK